MGKQLVSISCLLAATASLASLPAMAATFVVDKNFWGHTNTVGTFSWAIHQANETPGLDTIQLYSDVSLDDFLPTPESESYHFVADIRDPAGLVINGRGHSLTADPSFITPSGVVHTKTNPAPFKAGDFITGDSKSFARVHDSISNLFIDNLTVDGLNRFLRIGQNSSVTIKDSAFKNIGAFGHPGAPLLSALDDSMLNLQGVYMHNVNRYDDPLDGGEFTWFPVIEGTNANINIEKSMLDLYFSTTAGVLSQMGGTANVVSSVIMGKGLSIIDSAREGVLNVVNSLFRPYDHSATARIQAYRGGEANISASTIQFNGGRTTDVPSPSAPFPCPADYRCNGAPLQAFDGGMIHLNTSSVSVLNMGFARIEHPSSNVWGGSPGTLTADASSFVQPIPTQDAAALKALYNQINLLTDGVPYTIGSGGFLPHYLNVPEGAYPIRIGPLVNVVADADGANKLINPIDGTVITRDLFGNPRTRNGMRDVGAVQAIVPGPLPLLGCGGALAWSRRFRRRLRQAAA